MAVPECNLDTRTRENNNNKAKMEKIQQKRQLLEHQELNLAKALAGNDQKLRDKALKSLKKWMVNRSQALPFNEDDFMKIWKGLFYTMWMSDKPLVQEGCAESISHLVHMPQTNDSLLFYKCGIMLLINEWFGIDQLKIDKFLMLLRRLLRQAFFVLRNNRWEKHYIMKFNEILLETILNTVKVPPVGLSMHFIDIFLEELAKVSEGKMLDHTTSLFIKPFIQYIATSKDDRLIGHTKEHIFHHLLKQSDTGIDYEEKFNVWKSEGFPGGSIDCLQKQELSIDETCEEDYDDRITTNNDKPLDPRAGFVNVILPQLKFSPKQIIQLLEQYKFHADGTVKSRKTLANLIANYQELLRGKYPLGITKIELPNKEKDVIKRAAKDLIKFDLKLMGNDKKKKKRKLSNDIDDDVDEEVINKKVKLSNGISNGKKRSVKREAHKQLSKIEDEELEEYDFKFKRNSGTWIVTSGSNDNTQVKRKKISSNDFLETPEKITLNSINVNDTNGVDNSINDANSLHTAHSTKGKTKRKVAVNNEITTPLNKKLFQTSEWDTPLKDGEIEYLIPAKKFKKELKIKYGSSSLVMNPFSNNNKSKTSKIMDSGKKVNINLKLNKSQEIHEHHAQIKSSPGIPFDANKKPTKPLLKSKIGTPINPFSKKKFVK